MRFNNINDMDRTKDACRHQSNNRVIMWYKIRELYSKGFNKSQIAFQLGLHRSTVRRYLKMDEDTLTAKLQHRRRYPRILDKYESYVCDVLSRYRFLSASQIHDWMKEQYPDLPVVCGKTVYNFVETVRRKYNLDKEGLSKRVYEKMPDTPYGEYAQMDFGESRMPTYRNDFVKVYFFVMVMSRSRQKFVYFSCTPFTSALAVYAHELAFAYFGGKPRRIIYDQDKVLLVRENLGDLILTRTFRAFVNEQHFQPVFCRPADPESKGKVENVVKYVKRNFLAGRTFNSLEVLNTEVLQWLEKTGNGKIHGTTRLVPAEEFEIERKYLLPYYGEPVPPKDEPKEYHVRKDNTVRYRTNYYSVPSDTYKNRNTVVWLLENNGHIELYDKESGKLICRHELCPGKGKNVCDKRHHKDKTRSVNDLQVRIRKRTEDDPTVILWLRNLEREKPRYYRDNMKLLLHVISEYGKETVIAALRTCLEKNIYNSLSVQEISGSIHRSKDNMNGMTFQAPTSIPETADCHPEKTDINQYNKFFE